jgi:hypothetical protein
MAIPSARVCAWLARVHAPLASARASFGSLPGRVMAASAPTAARLRDTPLRGARPCQSGVSSRVLDIIVDINTGLGVAILMVEQTADVARSMAGREACLEKSTP